MAGRLDKVNRIQEEGAVIQGQIKDQVRSSDPSLLTVGVPPMAVSSSFSYPQGCCIEVGLQDGCQHLLT